VDSKAETEHFQHEAKNYGHPMQYNEKKPLASNLDLAVCPSLKINHDG